jgi:ATP-dependent Lon protease
MKESAPLIAKFFGIAAKVLKFIPGMQGVAKGYEAISQTAEGAELIYDFITEAKQSEVMEKGSKELIKRTKPVKKIAETLLKKKFGDRIPEPIRKKMAEEMEKLFEKYVADPAAKKLREEMEKNDTNKDLDKPLIDKLKKWMMPTPALP